MFNSSQNINMSSNTRMSVVYAAAKRNNPALKSIYQQCANIFGPNMAHLHKRVTGCD